MKENFEVVTFRGGIHPADEGKALSEKRQIQTPPLVSRYFVNLSQNIGKPPKITVEFGDMVKKGQLIAEADGFVSVPLHAPTSGKVIGLVDIPGIAGVPVKAIEIEADGNDELAELPPPLDWRNSSPDELKERIRASGIVGMGGAAFPTHVKLSPPPEKAINYLIINGAECEPYLTADHRSMLEYPDTLLTGAAIMGKILGVKEIIIGIEMNKLDAINSLLKRAKDFNIKVIGLKVLYPQGSEKQLIYAITKRKVPSGGLPMDSGCVVQNIGTAVAVAEAVSTGMPLIERITTVSGEGVAAPGNWRVKIGTPIASLIEWAGGVTEQIGKVILGGPMMGFSVRSLEVTVSKNTSGILLLPVRMVKQYASTGCLRCGKCLRGCPMNLLASVLSTAVEGGNFELAEDNFIMDCMECGSCAYVCPAHRPLVQHIRFGKAELRRRREEAAKNAVKN